MALHLLPFRYLLFGMAMGWLLAQILLMLLEQRHAHKKRQIVQEASNIDQSLQVQASNTQSLLTRLQVQLSNEQSLLTRLQDIDHDKHGRLHQRPELHELCLELHEMCFMRWKKCLELQALCLELHVQCQDVDKLCQDVHKLCPELQAYCLDLQKRFQDAHKLCQDLHKLCQEMYKRCQVVLELCHDLHGLCRIHELLELIKHLLVGRIDEHSDVASSF